MVEKIFLELPQLFQAGTVTTPASYYFSLGDIRKTVQLYPEKCVVTNGKVLDNADCVCKTSIEFFIKIWNEGYQPGLKDFLSGTIKSNKPEALKTFLGAFGKAS